MAVNFGTGTYDARTGTYTSPSGEKQSRRAENVPSGTQIYFSRGSGGTIYGGGTSTTTQASSTTTTIEIKKELPAVMVEDNTKKIYSSTTISNYNPEINAIAFTQYDERTGKPYGTYTPTEKPKGFLENVKRNIENERNIFTTEKSRGNVKGITENIKYNVGSFGLGVGSSYVNTGMFLKEVAVKPETAFINPILAVANLPTTLPVAIAVAKQEPFYAGGYVTGELSQALLVRKGTTTAVDYSRTLGRAEIPAKEVIAPEYFAGQKYPAIKSGQKAGDLLKEFEKDNVGYTATTKPLISPTIKGSSELSGLYQAPKLSPQFLRIKKENYKGFSINPFQETLRPTASKVTPVKYELIKGLTPKSNVGSVSLASARKFFETKAKKGVSYIPFIKTEKEAIIPFETNLEKLPSKTFFKFEGRRIPINEYRALGKETRPIKKVSTGTIKDISSSYSLPRSPSYITSLELSSLGRRSSKGSKPSYVNTYRSYTPPSIKGTSYISKSPSKPYISKSPSYKIPPYVKTYKIGLPPPIPPTSKGFTIPSTKSLAGKYQGRSPSRKTPSPKSKGLKEGVFYVPSFSSRFTGISTNITKGYKGGGLFRGRPKFKK